MQHDLFTAERVSKTATINLSESVEKVFPLFGPIEERKWADGWNPVVLYPESGELEEGMIFTTEGHGDGEIAFTWIVSKYEPESHLIQYIASTENRYWLVKIECFASSDTQTRATITYTYTGLNVFGNEINRRAIEKMYERDLKDWEEAINHYLKTGKVLKHQ